MKIFTEQNFAKITFLCAIALVAFLTLSTGALFIARKTDTLKQDLTDLENQFIADQKAQVKKDVLTLQAQIISRHATMERFFGQRLKDRVEEARSIAENLYSSLGKTLDDQALITAIREAIRPIRFNDKEGYCFIISLNGDVILYPADTHLEGSNFFTNEIDGGPEVVERLIAIAREQGQGYYRYNWTKPGDKSNTRYPKISYVTLIEQLGLIIGTGDYIDNLDLLTQRTVINELKNSLEKDVTDYFFFYQLHDINGGKDFASMIINNNRPDLVGRKLSDDIVDAKGNQFRKSFLEGIRENGEAFVVYWYKKTDGSGTGRKLSYFKLYPEWNWIIAKGIYFDRLDAAITTKKQQLSTKVKNDIIALIAIFLVGVSICLLAAYYLSTALQRIFNVYRDTRDVHLQKLEVLNKELERQSNTDALTDICNRSFFNKRLSREIALADRYHVPLSLVIFDIDKFKTVNDTLGHLAGDTVLKELARLISENIRESDIFARWGGEEFALLAPAIDRNEIALFTEKLRIIIENHPFSVEQRITCSFGATAYIPSETEEELLRRADNALYEAKNSGRNCCIMH